MRLYIMAVHAWWGPLLCACVCCSRWQVSRRGQIWRAMTHVCINGTLMRGCAALSVSLCTARAVHFLLCVAYVLLTPCTSLHCTVCVTGKVLVVHGGLFSKDGVTLDDIRKIDRFRC